MATTAVTFDSFPLIGATPGGGKAKLTGAGLDGWLSGHNARGRGRRTGGHGSWSTLAWRAEDPIVITGMIVYGTEAAAATERRQLLALGGQGESQLVVTDSAGTLGVAVEVDDVEVSPVNHRIVTFTYEVTATYPFKQAVTATTTAIAAGASVSFTNNGNAIAEWEATTTSSGTVVLTAGGLTLSTYSLPAGSVISSMPGRRGITGPSGEDLSSALVPGYLWPAVVPGSNSWSSSGSAGLSFVFYDSFA